MKMKTSTARRKFRRCEDLLLKVMMKTRNYSLNHLCFYFTAILAEPCCPFSIDHCNLKLAGNWLLRNTWNTSCHEKTSIYFTCFLFTMIISFHLQNERSEKYHIINNLLTLTVRSCREIS